MKQYKDEIFSLILAVAIGTIGALGQYYDTAICGIALIICICAATIHISRIRLKEKQEQEDESVS